MRPFLVHSFKLNTTGRGHQTKVHIIRYRRMERHSERESSYRAGGQMGDILQSSRKAGMINVYPAVLKGRGIILLEDTIQLTAFELQLRSTK